MTVSTGWANCDHVDYCELPENWNGLSEEDRDKWLSAAAMEYLHECCDAFAEVVDEDEED